MNHSLSGLSRIWREKPIISPVFSHFLRFDSVFGALFVTVDHPFHSFLFVRLGDRHTAAAGSKINHLLSVLSLILREKFILPPVFSQFLRFNLVSCALSIILFIRFYLFVLGDRPHSCCRHQNSPYVHSFSLLYGNVRRFESFRLTQQHCPRGALLEFYLLM